MHFGTWLKRLLIISLLIASFCIAVFGGKGELKEDSQIAESQDSSWNPANINLSSESSIESRLQNSPGTLASRAPNLKLEEESENNKSNLDKSKNQVEKSLQKPSSKTAVTSISPSTTAKLKPQVKKTVQSSKTQTLRTSQVNQTLYKTTKTFKSYKPKYAIAIAHSSNYGDRYRVDINGNPTNNPPIAVLHETSNSAMSAINTFKTSHNDDNKQVSYHALVAMDGTIVYLVPPDKRAFGAGNSVFAGPWGIETVKTNSSLPPSVNNFAYHVSLETPPDGRGKYHEKYHSGYTERQYKSLAWLLAQSSIPDERITTHRNVDRSGQRIDPRSFDFNKFFRILHSYRQSLS
ncbi:MAG: peptidoglycan recognition family protein [Cyanobacteria bacterium P01_A01_bin.45]